MKRSLISSIVLLIIILGIWQLSVSAVSTIFSDGFESDDFSVWTSADNKWDTSSSSAQEGTKKATVTGNTGDEIDVLLKQISTADYENLSLSYYYRIRKDFENSDVVKVEWSTDGTAWNVLKSIQGTASDSWTQETHALPGTATHSDFRFRFAASLSSGSDELLLDSITLTGTAITTPTPSASASSSPTPSPTASASPEPTPTPSPNMTILGSLSLTFDTLITNALSVKAQNQATLHSYTSTSKRQSISIPVDTIIQRSDSQADDFSQLAFTSPTKGDVAGLGANTLTDGVLQWGLAGRELTFSQPIRISLYVGEDVDAKTLRVRRSTTGRSNWTTEGIVEPATCQVSEGYCVFNATKASYYAATHPMTPTSSSQSGGGGGGGLPPEPSANTSSNQSTPTSSATVATSGSNTSAPAVNSAPVNTRSSAPTRQAQAASQTSRQSTTASEPNIQRNRFTDIKQPLKPQVTRDPYPLIRTTELPPAVPELDNRQIAQAGQQATTDNAQSLFAAISSHAIVKKYGLFVALGAGIILALAVLFRKSG